MRILIVTTSFTERCPDGSEAAGSFALDFSRSLSRSAEVAVVCPSTKASVEPGHPEIRRFAVPRLPLGDIKPFLPSSWPGIASVLSSGQKAVDAAVSSFRPDHILALWSLPSGWWARRAARRSHLGYSTWSLGSDIWSLGRIPFVKSVLRSVLAASRWRFADGLQLCSDVERICGKKCLFLPSSRDLGIESPPEKRPAPPYRLAFLGRWHPNKGVDILMEALEMLTDEDWERIEEFRICGGGQLEGLVASSASRLAALRRPVSVGGYLPRSAASDLLCWADIIVIPSRIESIPVIFSDALQAGCRIVATPAGDLPRLVPGGVGRLAESVSAESIARALSSALREGHPEQTDADDLRSRFSIRSAADYALARMSE